MSSIGIRSVTATQVFYSEDDDCFMIAVKLAADMSDFDFDFENYDYFPWDSPNEQSSTPITSPEQAKHLCENFDDFWFPVMTVLAKGD